MWALAKATLLVARYFRRIAVALESMLELYRLDCASRGILVINPKLKDEVEISYGARDVSEEVVWEE